MKSGWPTQGNQAYRINDKVYSFPMGVEGRGLIYNKTAIEKTLGKTFDPKEYNTMDKLKALLEELKSKGMATPVVISKEDWSLGSHYFGYLYITQSDDEGASAAYIDKLKKGEIDLKNDKRFNQLLDTFDLLRSYNINGKAPLDAKYEVDPSYVVDGEAAFWFNGNWAWPNMKEFVTADNKNEFGLMILPLGNDASDFVNTKMLGTASKQIIIDKTKTSEEEQKAAKDFLNWLVYDEAGQKGMVETLQLVPAFSNIKLEPTDPLGKALKVYVDEGKTSPDCIVPADHWSKVGAAMQQYLAGKSTREQLACQGAGVLEEQSVTVPINGTASRTRNAASGKRRPIHTAATRRDSHGQPCRKKAYHERKNKTGQPEIVFDICRAGRGSVPLRGRHPLPVRPGVDLYQLERHFRRGGLRGVSELCDRL